MTHEYCILGLVSMILWGTAFMFFFIWCIHKSGERYGESKKNGHEGSR